MAVITLQILKKFYDLHKDTNFWLERNEIRNAVLDYEKVAEYLWDIDEEYSQKLYDFIHKMEDEMYYTGKRLELKDQIKRQISNFIVGFYGKYLYQNDELVRKMMTLSKNATQLLKEKRSTGEVEARRLQDYIEQYDRKLGEEYYSKIKAIDYYDPNRFSKYIPIIEQYVGAAVKIAVIKLYEKLK